MKLLLLTIGKFKSKPIQALVDDYFGRLQHYMLSERIILRDETAWNGQPGDYLVVCDERGKSLSSVELSEFLQEHQMRATKRLVFFIGGPDGHSESLRKKAQLLLSFSRMTLPHEFASVILLEQLYRAATILKGEPYHK